MTKEIIKTEAKCFFNSHKDGKQPSESYEEYLERLVLLAYEEGFNLAALKFADNDDDTFNDIDIK